MGERTGWRDPDLKPWHVAHGFSYPTDDLVLSERHRKWGHVYGTDIDWPYVEYDYGIAVALVDYKLRDGLREKGGETDKTSYNNMALSDFHTSHGPLPYYINFYIKSPWTFRVFPMNDQAEQLAPQKQILTELEYVTWLHALRNKSINEYLARKLDNQLQWVSLLPPLTKSKTKKCRDKSPYTLFDQDPVVQRVWEEVPA